MSIVNQLFDLAGKTALITGGSRGLGKDMAKALAEAGAKIVINGQNLDTLQKTAEEFTAAGYEVETSPFDVRDEKSVVEAFEKLDAKGITIDILVNNAGIQHRQPMVDLSSADWQRVIDTNLTSTFLVGREAAKRMIAAGKGGKIINIGSLTSDVARATVAPYTAAKGGVKLLTKSMAAEWAKFNIQANAIGPGYMLTEMTQSLADDPQFDGWVKSRTPSERWGLPEDLMGTIIFLSSPASNYVNGQILYVDGGMLSVL